MTDTQGGEAAAVETTNDAAAQAALSSQDTASERDWEAEAREMGWVPEAEFKGDKRPKKFLSAEEFVERGETMIPILRKQLKDQETKFEERIGRMEKVHGKTVEQLQRQHQKEIESLKAERREAIKAGDADKVEKLDEQIDELKEAGPEPKLSGAALDKHNEKVQKDWIAANSWYETNEEMAAFALGFSQQLAGKNPDITIEDNLAQVDAAMRKKYPEHFGEKKPTGANGHAPVDSGGDFNGAPPARKDSLYAKLPKEAQTQCDKDIKAGIYKDKESWAKVYFE